MKIPIMTRMILAGMCALALACGSSGGGTGPSGGALNATLGTPHSDDGALLFTVRGPGIDSVIVAGAYSGYFRISANRDTAVIIIAGHVAAGVIAQVAVPNSSQFASYVATVNQVAQRTTFAQRALSGYSVAISQ